MDDAKSALKPQSVRRQALLRNADGSLILSLSDRKNVHDRLKAHTIDDSPMKTPFWRKRPLAPPNAQSEGGAGGLQSSGYQKTSQYVSQVRQNYGLQHEGYGAKRWVLGRREDGKYYIYRERS